MAYNNYAHVSISIPYELGEEIECKVEWTNESTGIGSYEYWGFKGYDKGVDYREIYCITPQFTDQNFETTARILEYIDSNFLLCTQDADERLDKYYMDQIDY